MFSKPHLSSWMAPTVVSGAYSRLFLGSTSTQIGVGTDAMDLAYCNFPDCGLILNTASVCDFPPAASSHFPEGSRLKFLGQQPRIGSCSIKESSPEVWSIANAEIVS